MCKRLDYLSSCGYENKMSKGARGLVDTQVACFHSIIWNVYGALHSQAQRSIADTSWSFDTSLSQGIRK